MQYFVQPNFPVPGSHIYTCPNCTAGRSILSFLDRAEGALSDNLKQLPKRLTAIKDASERWGETHTKAPRKKESALALKRRSMKYQASLYGLRFDFEEWKKVLQSHPKCWCGNNLTMKTAYCAYQDNFRPCCRFCVKRIKMPND